MKIISDSNMREQLSLCKAGDPVFFDYNRIDDKLWITDANANQLGYVDHPDDDMINGVLSGSCQGVISTDSGGNSSSIVMFFK